MIRSVVIFLILNWASSARAQHAHIYAGVQVQAPGQPLSFHNGNLWDTSSYGGYAGSPACIFLEINLPDLYPGLYQTATTFSALPATIFHAGPSPNAATLGTYIEMQVVSLAGPSGATLKVWDENIEPGQPTLLFSVPVGTTDGTNRFNLSEGDPADPTSDPYGHIHGRRFTLDKPGLYTVGLQLVDTSSNGPGGGPIHPPSAVRSFYLQAGLYLSDFTFTNSVATARFGLPGSRSYVFEASTVLPATSWVTVTNIVGTTHSELRWVTDPEATTPTKFYRIREEPIEP
jgi:hypothetical protein